MNAKYAEKPNLNPNEPNAAWPSGWHLQAQLVGGLSFWRTPESRFFCWKPEAGCRKLVHKNEPNFFTTKYALSISKTQKWRPKNNPKKRNEPNLNESLTIVRWVVILSVAKNPFGQSKIENRQSSILCAWRHWITFADGKQYNGYHLSSTVERLCLFRSWVWKWSIFPQNPVGRGFFKG